MTYTHRVVGHDWDTRITVSPDGVCTRTEDKDRAWMANMTIEHIRHWVRQRGGKVVKIYAKSHH